MSDFETNQATAASVTTADAAPTTGNVATNGKTALTDAFRTHFGGDAPLVEKAKGFARERPWASAALVGVAAIALLNTLRGKRA